MRENRTCGSEGGEAQSLPYPYPFPLGFPAGWKAGAPMPSAPGIRFHDVNQTPTHPP